MLSAEVAILPERHGRRIVNLAAALRDGGLVGHKVLVTNLSGTGCQINTDARIPKGTEILLKLTAELPLRARIMWSGDEAAGCDFATPLAASTISAFTSNLHLQGKRLFGPGKDSGRWNSRRG